MDDNFIHLSPSASNINEASSSEVEKPKRLSKSEENLIDLDTPDEIQSFTLENPLYELAAVDSEVFTDSRFNEEQLLRDYGLIDYFSNLKLSSTCSPGTASVGLNHIGGEKSFSVLEQSTSDTSTNSNWATFE